MPETPKEITAYLRSIGTKGGTSKSPAKVQAAKENARKARVARAEKRAKKINETQED